MNQQTQQHNNRLAEVIPHVKTMRGFMSDQQIAILGSCFRTEEADFAFDKFEEYADRVTNMHKSYEQDGKGKDAIVHLHYFRGGMDWYITEKDMENEQHQAFGWADLGHGGEFGYISIEELKANNIEMDLFWEPKPLKDCI